jgi:hypothetical protein
MALSDGKPSSYLLLCPAALRAHEHAKVKVMQRTAVIFNQALIILLLSALPLTLVCNKYSESEDALDSLLKARDIELIHEVPLRFDTYLASDGKNLLYGVNWDALNFYIWDFEGHLKQKVDSPTSMAYQDIKYFAGKLLCSGHKGGNSAIDIIDPESWTLTKRIDLPRDGWKKTLSSEGMAYDGNLYFLPEDGPDSKIMIFTLAR